MIAKRNPLTILANLSNRSPVDLDGSVFRSRKLRKPTGVGLLSFPPCDSLWEMKEKGVSRIGLRINAPVESPEFLAGRLAAIAIERNVHPVFLSYVDRCSMQRFGFRVEHLSGLPKGVQQQYEAQLVRFWRLALVIDASEIASLR